MSKFKEYKDRYDCVRMERRDGILQLTLHTNGGPLVWASGPHEELAYCFTDVATDIENKLVILTGTGDEFIAQRQTRPAPFVASRVWDRTLWEGKRLLMNLLGITKKGGHFHAASPYLKGRKGEWRWRKKHPEKLTARGSPSFS